MTSTLFDTGVRKSAVLSDCGTYRYNLRRVWDADLPVCNFLMLNPSTADAFQDDPTIRRCIGFSQSWGYGSLVVTNLFALRSTDPAILKSYRDPVGPDNDRFILMNAAEAAVVVAAWGNHGKYRGRATMVRGILRARGITLSALRIAKTGEPWHPLYLPNGLRPVEFTRPISSGATF